MKKYHKIGIISLILTGVSAICGSGWLFSAYYAVKYAGMNAYMLWIIGASIALLLSLMLAEIVTLYPKRGLFARLLTLSHDHDTGYIPALVNWLGVTAVISAEAVASVQYLANINPHWTFYLYDKTQSALTGLGLFCCMLLVIVFGLLNFWGIRLFAKSNNVLTIFKIFIPIFVAIAIISVAFHPSNFVTNSYHKLRPHGFSSILNAITASGIIYAFNGFQSISSLCVEAKNPVRNIPLAMAIAILTCLLIYFLIQTAFIGGLPPAMLNHGWQALNFESPMVNLTLLLGLNIVSIITYVGACIGPLGCGLVFTTTSTRILTALSQEQQAPSFFNVLHPKYHFSRRSLICNIIIANIFLFFSRNWHNLAILISMFHIISYMACPLALMRLRIKEPHRLKSSYRMPLASLMCPLLFIAMAFLISLALEKFILITTILVSTFYLMYITVHNKWRLIDIWHSLQRSYTLPFYFIWLAFLGLLGNPKGSSLHLVSHNMFYVIITLSSLFFYYRMVYKYKPSPYFFH